MSEAPYDDPAVEALIAAALQEDRATEDITAAALVPADRAVAAVMRAKAPGVLCGLPLTDRILAALPGETPTVTALAEDGDTVGAGTPLLRIEGAARTILAAERTILNFVQRLSGVATLAAAFAEALMATHAGVYDTRKTTPGWRALEKHAVVTGGGRNHRMDLADAAMIKENHLVAAYGETGPAAVAQGVRALLAAVAAPVTAYVEVESLDELDAVLEAAGEDRGRLVLMLDDFGLGDIRAAVKRVRELAAPRPALEVTGGVTLAKIEGLASTGVGRISSGALTHSARALDISLKIERETS